MPKRNRNQAAGKGHGSTKHKPSGIMIDGIGGAGGASGTGGVEAKLTQIGDISGIDPHLDADEIPAPGSTGKAGPAHGRQGHAEGGMSGKNRGPDSETEPSRDDDGE